MYLEPRQLLHRVSDVRHALSLQSGTTPGKERVRQRLLQILVFLDGLSVFFVGEQQIAVREEDAFLDEGTSITGLAVTSSHAICARTNATDEDGVVTQLLCEFFAADQDGRRCVRHLAAVQHMDGRARSAQVIAGYRVCSDEATSVLGGKRIHMAGLSLGVVLSLVAVLHCYLRHVFTGGSECAHMLLCHGCVLSSLVTASLEVEIGV